LGDGLALDPIEVSKEGGVEHHRDVGLADAVEDGCEDGDGVTL
jgi:hypothetical protein